MANSAQARKRARQAEQARQHNASQRSAFRTAVKKVLKAIEAGDKAAAQSVYQQSVSVIDRLSDKARSLWVPTGNRNAYYDLRAAIHIVREDILSGLGERGSR